MSMAT